MYVVILIINGDIKASANKKNPSDALTHAQEWVTRYRDKDVNGHIIIEEQVRGKDTNRHFAKVTFENEPDNIKFYLREKGEHPLISSRISPVFKSFVFTFLEFALVELKDHMKDQQRSGTKSLRDRF